MLRCPTFIRDLVGGKHKIENLSTEHHFGREIQVRSIGNQIKSELLAISDKNIILHCLLDIEKYSSMKELFIPSVHESLKKLILLTKVLDV